MNWRKIDPTRVNRTGVKVSVVICNIVIMALCLVAVLAMAFGKFWTVGAKITVNKEVADRLFGQQTSIDTTVFEQKPLDMELKFSVTSKLMIKGVFQNDTKIADSLITEQVNSVMSNFRPLLGTFASVAVQAAKPQITETLASALKSVFPNELGSSADYAAIKAELSAQFNVDAQVIEDAVMDIMLNDIIIGCFVSENPNAADIKTNMNANIDKIMNELSSNATLKATLNLTEQKIDSIKQSGSKVIDEFTQGDKLNEIGGTIIHAVRVGGDMMEALNSTGIIESFTKIFDEMKNVAPLTNAAVAETTVPPSEQAGTMEEELRALLTEKIPDSATASLSLTLRVVGILYMISMLSFAVLFIVTLLKTLFAKYKGVRMGWTIWLGGWWGILLVALPLIALVILPHIGALAGAAGILAMVQLKFMSASIVATACTIGMCILWFFYARPRKKLKAVVYAEMHGYEG